MPRKHEAVEKRRQLIAKLLVQNKRPGQIYEALQKLYHQDTVKYEWANISRRQLTKDQAAIRRENLARGQLISPSDIVAKTLASVEAEEEELWNVITSCGNDPRYASTKTGALNAIRALRESTLNVLVRLGAVPERVMDDVVAWIMTLNMNQLGHLVKAGPEGMAKLMEDRMRGKDLKLMAAEDGEIVLDDQ